MRRPLLPLVVVLSLLGLAADVSAQAPPAAPAAGLPIAPAAAPTDAPTSAPVAVPPAVTPSREAPRPKADDPEIAPALKAWLRALERKPALVSLGSLDSLTEDHDIAKVLADRLKLLTRKKVSNRQWSDYWAKQAKLAGELAALYEPHRRHKRRAAGLRDWAALAADKVTNQAQYLTSIENERDAVEERLEATVTRVGSDGKTDAPPEAPHVQAGKRPSPFELRAHRIDELEYRIRQQEAKLALAEIDKKHNIRQSATQVIIDEALVKDLDLAERERDIAADQATSKDPEWARLWGGIAEEATVKVRALAHEVGLGEQRARALEVELSLLESAIEYRAAKSDELGARLELETSVESWLDAVGDTGWQWLKERGWQVVLILLFVFFGLKIMLRMIGLTSRTILKAVEDDDPDNLSAEEARAATIASVVRSVAQVTVYAIAILIAMEAIGINTAPILGSVAILGLAVSFGSQNLVRDVVNGFFILLEDQFAVGDVVSIGGTSGVVEQINLRSTRVRESNGTLNVIPNGSISSVANLTRDWARAIVHIGVGYEAEIGRVQEVIDAAGEALFADPEMAHKLQEAPVFVGVTALGDSAVTVRVMCKVEPGEQWGVERALNRSMKEALDAAGIDIPFPQQVVWHKNAGET